MIACQDRGLSSRHTAHVLAIAKVESGFNPDAAAGTTYAYGMGQFVKNTGNYYGLNTKENRLDVDKQINALVDHYLDNSKLEQGREEYIYKYPHDGPKEDHGGLSISRKEVMPLIDKYQEIVEKYSQEKKSKPVKKERKNMK